MRVGLAALGGNFWHPIDLIRGKQTNLRYSGRKSITWGAGNNALPGDQGIWKPGMIERMVCSHVGWSGNSLFDFRKIIFLTKFIFNFTITIILQKYRNFTKNSSISHSQHSLIQLVNFAKHKKFGDYHTPIKSFLTFLEEMKTTDKNVPRPSL